jgi:hypothetical protein
MSAERDTPVEVRAHQWKLGVIWARVLGLPAGTQTVKLFHDLEHGRLCNKHDKQRIFLRPHVRRQRLIIDSFRSLSAMLSKTTWIS